MVIADGLCDVRRAETERVGDSASLMLREGAYLTYKVFWSVPRKACLEAVSLLAWVGMGVWTLSPAGQLIPVRPRNSHIWGANGSQTGALSSPPPLSVRGRKENSSKGVLGAPFRGLRRRCACSQKGREE